MRRFGNSASARVFAVFSGALIVVAGCSHGSVLRGRVDGVRGVIEAADQGGARKCAPRELALAKSHARFAADALDQGKLSSAESHLLIAEPNARAANALTSPDRCADRSGVGDRDGDGIPDAVDKCPDQRETWNRFQDDDGCPDDPDTDGDGIPDSRDMCVLEPEDFDGYLDADGCPDLDNDADGIVDTKDNCPNQPEDPDGFEDDDGCPESDNDKDGVLDVDDFCPNTPGPASGDRPGCPKRDVPVFVTAREIRITQQIQFEFNKAVIKKESYRILDAIRDVLKDNPQIRIEVQGHTDNVGGAAYNQKLSEARSASVRAYLVQHGVASSRLTSKGFGMSQPLLPNSTEANRSLNRRVQFIRTEVQPAQPAQP